MIRKCGVMMLMIMLIVTHVECNSPSQKFGPTKLKGLPRSWCVFKCNMSCLKDMIHNKFDECVIDCENKKC
jgi:hypothetical protein